MFASLSYIYGGIHTLFQSCRLLFHTPNLNPENAPQQAVPKPLATPLFALLIGINNYRSISRLEGASADAQAVQRYLEDDLGVPTDQIVVLLDEQATRAAIIQALQALANNSKIEQGDAILIFFAGHGTVVPFQAEGRVTEERIQSVLSQDFDGQTVHPIPDYALGNLVAAVYREKGDNITVILDCCYSGSGTRQAADPYVSRCVALPESYGIPRGLDDELVQTHTRGISQVHAPGELTTHTLLAACNAHEQARELNGRGQFTTALLQLLGSIDLSQLTYADVIDQVKVSGQNPQCEGINRDRLFFGNKITSSKQSYPVEIRDGTPVLLAGVIDTISVGAYVDIYSNKAAIGRLPPLGNAMVKSVDAFESALQMSKPLPSPKNNLKRVYFAVQVKPGASQDPGLYLPPDGKLDVVREALVALRSENAHINFSLVDDRSKALLEITTVVEDDTTMLKLDMLDDLITSYGFHGPATKLPANAENATRLLKAAAHFFYQLHSSFPNSIIQEKVKVEFRQLKGKSKRTVVAGEDLLVDGKLTVNFIKGQRVLHGIRLVNNTNSALYVHAFYFDCSQVSIAHFYGMPPPMQFTLDPQLPAGSPLTLGYGTGGANALSFYVPEEQDNDLGFFKFVFATRPVNLGSIPVDNPFESPTTEGSTRGGRRPPQILRNQTMPPEQPDAFGSLLIPIIIKRASS